MTISAIIHTKNEAANIATAIESVRRLTDDVLVADMASSDDTRSIAASLGARVLEVPDFGYVEPARHLALEATEGDWIFILDADEVLPRPLIARLQQIAAAGEADVVRMSRRTYMMGAPLTGSGWSLARDRQIRFYRRGSLSHRDEIHSVPDLADGARLLELPAEIDLAIVHFNYLGWDHFVEKLNRYTDIEARQIFATGGHIPRRDMLRQARREFWDRFVRDRGYRDGYRGFVLSWLMAGYRLLTFAKVRQLHEAGDTAAIALGYGEVARDL